jgi:hypothetical protein
MRWRVSAPRVRRLAPSLSNGWLEWDFTEIFYLPQQIAGIVSPKLCWRQCETPMPG